MQVKKYNISKPKEYIDKQGEKKTQWNNVGYMTEFYKDDGSVSRIMEIPTIGLEANIFPVEPREPREPREQGQYQQNASPPSAQNTAEKEEIKVEDIPF